MSTLKEVFEREALVAALTEPLTPNLVSAYLASIGSRGGKAGTGKSKARSSAQARKAARARWDKPKVDSAPPAA